MAFLDTALTHWYWHSSAGSSLSDSLLVRSKRLGHVYNFRDNFDCFRDSRTKGQFPGQSRNSGTVGKYVGEC